MIFSSCLLQTAAHRTPMINQSLCLHLETAARVSSAHPTVHVARTFSHMESKCKLSLLLFLPVVFTDSSTPDLCMLAASTQPTCCTYVQESIYVQHLPCACQICVYVFTRSCVQSTSKRICMHVFVFLQKCAGVRVGGGWLLKSVCAYSHTQE